MNTEDKIKELLNECPINKAHLTEDELSAYHQGLRCGAYNMAEWKEQQMIDRAIIFFEGNFNSFIDGGVLGVFNNKTTMIEEFKQAIKGE